MNATPSKTSWLYEITTTHSQKVYVGKTINPNRRWGQHRYYAKANSNSHLHRAIRKYGVTSFTFTLIECFTTELECYNAEVKLIAHYKALGISFNEAVGGYGGNLTPEGKWRHRSSLIGNTRGLGYKHTSEHKLSLVGSGNPNYKYPLELIASYATQKEATEATGISKTHYRRLKKANPKLWNKAE